MFNLGFSEIIVLGIIALVFIGPKQLPEVARVVGRLLNEWKRASSEFTDSFKQNDAFREWEERRQQYLADINNSINSSGDSQPADAVYDPSQHGIGHDHAHGVDLQSPDAQIEMNLEVQEGVETDPKKPDGSHS